MAADLCAFCGLTAAAYTCPKCRARTCCLPCYRAHNEGLCAAEFATATVKEQLAATFAPPSDRQHVLAALRRLNEDDGGGDEVAEAHSDGDDEVLARLDSSRTASDLTDEERRALARQFGKEGVRTARPWWARPSAALDCRISATGAALIVDSARATTGGDDDGEDDDAYGRVPPLPAKPPPPLAQLLGAAAAAPHESVRHQLTVAAFAYCVAYETVGGALVSAALAHDATDVLWAFVADLVQPSPTPGAPAPAVRSAAAAWEHALAVAAAPSVSPVASDSGTHRKQFAAQVARHGALALLALGRGAVVRLLHHAREAAQAVRGSGADGADGTEAPGVRRTRRRRATMLDQRLAFLLSVAAHTEDAAMEDWHAEAAGVLNAMISPDSRNGAPVDDAFKRLVL